MATSSQTPLDDLHDLINESLNLMGELGENLQVCGDTALAVDGLTAGEAQLLMHLRYSQCREVRDFLTFLVKRLTDDSVGTMASIYD